MKAIPTSTLFFCLALMTFAFATDAISWTYSTETVEYQGGPDVIGTLPGRTYTYRVAVITNDKAVPQTLSMVLNYHDGFIGAFLYSTDQGHEWFEVPKEEQRLVINDIAPGNSVWVRAVIIKYRYLSTSPWGEIDKNSGLDYYFAYAPGGQYYEPGSDTVNKTGYVAVVEGVLPPPGTVWYKDLMWQQSSADIDGDGVIDDIRNSMGPDNLNWQDAVDFCDSLDFAGFTDWRLPTKDELKGLVVCTNGTHTPLNDRGEGGLWFCGDGDPPYERPTIDQELFSAKTQDYWTSNLAGETGYAYKVNFYWGACEPCNMAVRRRVRCVRP